MAKRSLSVDDGLEDFSARPVVIDGATKVAHVSGVEPAFIVISGISPPVARVTRWVIEAGPPSTRRRYSAAATAGEGGGDISPSLHQRRIPGVRWRRTSPVTQWLQGLVRLAHDECGGRRRRAIGLYFNGNIALSMMLEPAVLTPVLSRPSLPMDDPVGIEISPREVAVVRERLERGDLKIRAYKLEGDRFRQAQRFATYRNALCDRFIRRVLLDAAANITARDEILDFFDSRRALSKPKRGGRDVYNRAICRLFEPTI